MNKKKILRAELIIITLVLLLVILPQVIGTVNVKEQGGDIDIIYSLDQRAGAASDEHIADMTALILPNAVIRTDMTDADAADALGRGSIDFYVTSKDTAYEMADADEKLYIFPELICNAYQSTIPDDESYYILIRKEDYAYGTTNLRFEDCCDENVTIAYLSGLSLADKAADILPNATMEAYNSNVDAFTALETGKCDYCVSYMGSQNEMLPSCPNLTFVTTPIAHAGQSFVASKTDRGRLLCSQFDEYLEEIKQSGKYDEIVNKWKNSLENEYHLEEYNYTGENGVIKIVVGANWVPNCFIYNNELMGTFVDLSCGFAERYGYTPEFYIADYAAELAGVSTGVYDFMADVCEKTPERENNVYFTEPLLYTYYQLMTRTDDGAYVTQSKLSYTFSSLYDNLMKTFVEQDRYKMVLEGLAMTVLIAVLSALFGTILGGVICFMRMHKNPYITGFARMYIKIIQGIPIVVLLMILFYVVFADININGFWVAIIGFSVDYSAYVSEIFRSGIEAVPQGQMRAARALGFGPKGAFIKVVLPQAMIHFIPVYIGQFISLVKLTSVVGYIAVLDLTKVSDMIRSVTYAAFFPLLVTAVIYFLLSSVLVLLLRRVEKKINPIYNTDRNKRMRRLKVNAD